MILDNWWNCPLFAVTREEVELNQAGQDNTIDTQLQKVA